MKLTAKQMEKLNKALDGRPASLQDIQQVLNGIEKMITLCGREIDAEMEESPFRIFKAFLELTKGYAEDPKEHLTKTFDVDFSDDIVLVKDIPFNSLCAHHALSFIGNVHIAYVPGTKVTGLSKFGRLVDGYAKRFQTQEVLTKQIGKAIEEVLDARGVMVVITGEHMCMSLRGIQKMGAKTTTIYTSGELGTNEKRKEVLEMIKLQGGLF